MNQLVGASCGAAGSLGFGSSKEWVDDPMSIAIDLCCKILVFDCFFMFFVIFILLLVLFYLDFSKKSHCLSTDSRPTVYGH